MKFTQSQYHCFSPLISHFIADATIAAIINVAIMIAIVVPVSAVPLYNDQAIAHPVARIAIKMSEAKALKRLMASPSII